MHPIQMVDLKRQHHKIKAEVDEAVLNVIESTAFINGRPVQEFADNLSAYLGVKHVIPCANGTDALQIAMMALNLKPGDEVITPSFTFIATTEVIALLRLTPVFVEVDPKTFCMDPVALEKAITPKTKAIVPVHLYGHSAPLDEIMAIAKKYNLIVIEDNAQAIGGDYISKNAKKKTGTIGHVGTTSFFPSKNLGAYGDAGAMLTNDDELAAVSRQIANHGQIKKHHHVREGRNSRMDTLQAAILLAKLPYLEQWTKQRVKHAILYNELLKDTDVIIPLTNNKCSHVYHLYVIRTGNREALQAYLSENDIETAVHYPTALPLLPCYSYNNYTSEDFPVAYHNQSRLLSLPMYAELNNEQIEYVAGLIKSFHK
jgi:dTDP-4-amino-4,6-dideoxygalactose transaminase